uniref:WAT1-related protein At3g28050 isoform X2 n=1 Tax=Rhizophora mucronata TaxID=61149 RepID=A0A2P2JWK8_RHIMU
MMNMEAKVALPFMGMVMAESAQVGLMIISKAVMSKGMSNLIFVFYSNALASLILLPSSLLFHRSQRPPLTFSIVCGFFLLGLFGFSGMLGLTLVLLHLAQLCSTSFLALPLYLQLFSGYAFLFDAITA